jgi:acetate kinase
VRILVLNPGSATLKTTVLDLPDLEPRFTSSVDWATSDGDGVDDTVAEAANDMALVGIPLDSIDGVGYRVVHGGERFTDAVVVDDTVVVAIEDLADLAPLHNPVAAATIRSGRRALPAVPHVAAFDTAFHATLPESGRRYPVPDDWVTTGGVRRYGFHGLSVAWSTERAAVLLDRPTADLCLVVAHLGGGCSVTAVESGRSVDTSMGMTPLEGLMMGTRAGSIDPGIIFRLLRAGRDASAIEADLDRRSGLMGVGGTADMADLLERKAGGQREASLAIDLFIRRAAAGIAAAATCLPRVDAIAFTGGIGEHAPVIREGICERLAMLRLPEQSGSTEDDRDGDAVLASGAGPALLRIHAREDVMVARATAAAIGNRTVPGAS